MLTTYASALYELNAFQVSGVAWFSFKVVRAVYDVRAIVRARRRRRLRPRVAFRAGQGTPPHLVAVS